MAKPKPTIFVEARAELEKVGVRARLKKLAFRRTRNDADADDLVQQALARVFDPKGSPWDPRGTVSFFRHTGSVVNSVASTAWRSARARREVLDGNLDDDEGTVDGAPLADAVLGDHDEGQEVLRLGDLLLARIGDGDSVARDVILAARDGFETPAEQAAALHLSVEQVRKAYERLRYQAKLVLEEEKALAGRRAPEREGTARRERGAR